MSSAKEKIRVELRDTISGRFIKGHTMGSRHNKVGPVHYKTYHKRVVWVRGNPSKCEHCSTEVGTFHWANKDHQNYRDVDNYLRLCSKCHFSYDIANGFREWGEDYPTRERQQG